MLHFKCPDCGCTTDWSDIEMVKQGTPVCPTDGCDMELNQDKPLADDLIRTLVSALQEAEGFINSIENYNDEAKEVHETIKAALADAQPDTTPPVQAFIIGI